MHLGYSLTVALYLFYKTGTNLSEKIDALMNAVFFAERFDFVSCVRQLIEVIFNIQILTIDF